MSVKPNYVNVLEPVGSHDTNPFPGPVITKGINMSSTNKEIDDISVIAFVAHRWPEILQVRHLTALVRFGRAHGMSDREKMDQSAAYLNAIGLLMEIDDVEPLDLGEE